MNATNQQVILRSRPDGIPGPEHFALEERAVPGLQPGQVLVRNIYLSVEPAMRGWVNAAPNYSPPVPVGDVMRAFAVGHVAASKDPAYREGDAVTGMFGWQSWAVVDAARIDRKVGSGATAGLPLSTALRVLGLNGITAYFGLLEVGQPRAGDTVLVSTAAGSVGSAAGQIAKIAGCRTVGIAGGAEKTALCTGAFGYDAAVDYKAADWRLRLDAACPAGADVYFDNTAGPISDAAHALLAPRARIVVCGTASVSSWSPPPMGPRIERHILVKRARMAAVLAFDYRDRFQEAITRLAGWVRDGRLAYQEDVLHGIQHAPGSIQRLYRGENRGKLLIKVGEDA